MKEKVTWLIPIKNGMPYLTETLASIEAQTYKNWEVLAWDDGSTDKTLEELKKWIPSRLPGRIMTGKPLGVGGALAKMIEECNTELCARIDADDINLPNRLEEQISFLEENPEVAVVGTQMYCIDAEGKRRKHLYSVPTSHQDIVHTLLFKNSLAHPSVLFRRSAILAIGNYKPFPNVEDYDLWLRLAKRFKLANLNKPLVCYRIHEKSVTQKAHAKKTITHRLNERFYEHAYSLYGCSKPEARLLRERRHIFPIKTLIQIAKHLEISQMEIKGELTPVNALTRIRSSSFIEAGRALISPLDFISHFFLTIMDPDKGLIPLKLGRATYKKLKSFSVVTSFE